MAALSALRNSSLGLRCFLTNSTILTKNSVPNSTIMKALLREMGTHKRTLVITPSRFQWKKFKDMMHFYTMLGAIPLGALMLYTNIFIGPAELAEIPEGYEPKHWEYYHNPISRWFSRYVYKTEQEHYEKYLHWVCQVEEQRQMRIIEKKVHELMKTRGDYMSWHYLPISGKHHRIVRDDEEKIMKDYYGQN